MWFICAAHRVMPPRSDSYANFPEGSQNVPLEQYSALPPWFKDVDPNEDEKFGECELPALLPANRLPLAHWDGVFYAIAVEIKHLYHKLQKHYGDDFEKGATVLHNHGLHGLGGCNVTVRDFAWFLEQCWDKIMNPLLYASLEFAIMQRNAFAIYKELPTLNRMLKAHGLKQLDMNATKRAFISLALNQAPAMREAVRSSAQENPCLVEAHTSMHARRKELAEQKKLSRATGAAARNELPKTPSPAKQLPSPPEPTDASPSDEGLFQKEIDESRRTKASTDLSVDQQTSPETKPTSSISLQSFPAFDDTRPLPKVPSNDRVANENLPTLKRMPPRSNTGSSAQVSFGQSDPLAPVKRSSGEQRYVAAGGNTPLHERSVMEGYEIRRELTEGTTFNANKEQFFADIDAKKQVDDHARKSETPSGSVKERGRLRRFFSSSSKSFGE